ncbi:hypothetical protein ABBQ38_005672 [Trebouxia sp. C0009 RCD-2024]
MTVTARTRLHVSKQQSSLHSKSLLCTSVSAAVRDSTPVGKGMTVAHVRSALASRAEPDAVWKAKHEALQAEVQHLRHLLSLASISPDPQSSSKACNSLAPGCSMSAASHASGTTSSALPSHSAGLPGVTASSSLGLQLKREELLKWKAAQLERQVIVLQAALQSRSEVALEAESVLSELSHHLTHVIKEPIGSDHQLQSKAADLRTYSQQMLTRLSRLTRQSSLSQARSNCQAPVPSLAFSSRHASQTWGVPFYAAPGTLRQLPQEGISVVGLCEGKGALLADPLAAQQLESDLANLAPRLSSLAVLLRAAVLPAMSLVNPKAATRLRVEVAETAEAVAQSAHALTQLAILLPSHTALFGQAAGIAARKEGAIKSAGQHSRDWQVASASSPPEVPSAQQLLAQMPPFSLKQKAAVSQVLTPVLDRLRLEEQTQRAKQACLAREVHYLRSLQASQAQHVRKLFSFAQDALHELQPATAVATVQSAEALRKVLEAQQRLSSHPCETTLKQVISALREAAPDLQQACWLLVSQQKDLKTQVDGYFAGQKKFFVYADVVCQG